MKLRSIENKWSNFCFVCSLLPSILLHKFNFSYFLLFQDSNEFMNMIGLLKKSIVGTVIIIDWTDLHDS